MLLRRSYLRRLPQITTILWLFERSKTVQDETIHEALQKVEARLDSGRIRCPLCQWQPNASSRWQCSDCAEPEYFFNGCGAVWNTFDTSGCCPGCGHQWRWTMCLSCWHWSLHQDWYTEVMGNE